jgi:outer membrane protein assembly factor BamB
MNTPSLISIFVFLLLPFTFGGGPIAGAANWPSWRGDVAGSGIASETNLPLEWSDTKNIRWSVKLPERGNSTAVVWGERVFVNQAIEAENRRTLMCFHRADGRLLWQKGVVYAERERSHPSNPYCSASPVTDGERVIVSFGSAGLACYDFNGRELWRRDFGKLDNLWGNASSPVIFEDLCFHYCGPTKNASLVVLDKKTGKTVWKFDEPAWDTSERTDGFKGKSDGVVGAWSTPIVIRAGGRDELVMTFPQEVRAFDPRTGRELWRCGGLSPLIYTSPVFGEGIVVGMGCYYGNSLAVKPGGGGDVTATRRAWHQVRSKVGIGSGVIKDGHIYHVQSSGAVTCLKLATGELVWEAKPQGIGKKAGSWSSITLIGDRLYYPNQSGDVVVLKAGPKFEQLAVNPLKEPTNASIAVSDGELFLRTEKTLWCISAKAPASAR